MDKKRLFEAVRGQKGELYIVWPATTMASDMRDEFWELVIGKAQEIGKNINHSEDDRKKVRAIARMVRDSLAKR